MLSSLLLVLKCIWLVEIVVSMLEFCSNFCIIVVFLVFIVGWGSGSFRVINVLFSKLCVGVLVCGSIYCVVVSWLCGFGWCSSGWLLCSKINIFFLNNVLL